MKAIIGLFLCMIIYGGLASQDFVRLSDRDKFELAVDMVRKGIQQEDAEKLILISGSTIGTGDKFIRTGPDFRDELDLIFSKAHSLKGLLPCPDLPRSDTRLTGSAFWDFAIIDHDILIEDDSAIVNCTLVLWNYKSKGNALKIPERFVFRAQEASPVPNGEDVILWSESQQTKKTRFPKSKQWQLTGFVSLLEILYMRVRN